jgi:CheY-like chemotaxis protein
VGESGLDHPDASVVRVLCVDDCSDAADALAALLELAGFQVRVCYSGTEAEAALDEFRPHACLIDLMMPGMDGLELAHRVRTWAGDRYVPLVAVTALGDEQSLRRTAAAGFDLHLLKPAEPDRLAAVLADLIILRGDVRDCPAGR